MFNSLDEFNTYITGSSYKYDVCFGVNVVQEDTLTYSTTLMYNTTGNSKIKKAFIVRGNKIANSECFWYFTGDPDIPDTSGDEVLDYKPQNADDFY
jgi:hypothetical protein